MQQIFGPAGEDLLWTEDPVQDKNIVLGFVAEAHQKNSINIDPKNPNRAVLVVGNTGWPMPIPIVKKNGKWLFDTKAGRQEMLSGALERMNSMRLISVAAMWNRSTNMPWKGMMGPK